MNKIKPKDKANWLERKQSNKKERQGFEFLRNSALAEAWNKVKCQCAQLLKEKPCSLNCKEFE